MLSDAIGYPFESDRSLETLAIGGLLMLFGVFLLPLFIVYGYFLQVYTATLNGEDEPPALVASDFMELLKDGALYLVISVCYLLIPSLLFLLGFALLFVGGAVDSAGPILPAVLLMGVGGLLYLAVGYLLPAAVLNYTDSNEFAAAFQLNEITDIVFTRPYATAFLIVFGLGIGISLFSGVVGLIPIVGWILPVFISFYFGMVTHRLYAQAYRECQLT